MPFERADALGLIALSAMLMAALVQDVRSRKISNNLVLAGALTGFGLACMPAGVGAATSLSGGMVGLVLFGPLYLWRLLGAGDVKLVAAIGFFVGFPAIAQVALNIFIAGGFLSLAWGWWTAQLLPAMHNLTHQWAKSHPTQFKNEPQKRGSVTPERVPYALAIAAGTWLQVIGSWHPF